MSWYGDVYHGGCGQTAGRHTSSMFYWITLISMPTDAIERTSVDEFSVCVG